MTLLVRGRLTNLGAPVIVTLGNFDGVHRGHLELLAKIKERKGYWISQGANPTAIAISFHPHPARVLAKNSDIKLIYSLRQRLEALSKHQIDILYMLHFTERVAALSAADFIETVLFGKLKTDELILGDEAAFGFKREGNATFLSDYFKRAGKVFIPVPQLETTGQRVSSGRIRDLIRSGQVDKVKELLGSFFTLDAYVQHGDGRGREIGYPTANLKPNEQLWPQAGVYACIASLAGVSYPAVTNIGCCPTFKGERYTTEVHFLCDKKLELYGKRIQVQFIQQLRLEKKFDSVNELQQQIAKDIENARIVLEQNKEK